MQFVLVVKFLQYILKLVIENRTKIAKGYRQQTKYDIAIFHTQGPGN